MKCLVCKTEPSRYRCRHCKSAYCSSNCFKVHRVWNTQYDDALAAGQSKESLPEPLAFTCEYVLREQGASDSAPTNKEAVASTSPSPSTADEQSDNKAPRADASATTTSTTEDLFSDATQDDLKQRRREAQTHVAPTSSTSSSDGPHLPPLDDDEGEGQLCMLRERHLSALANSPALRNALKTPELQSMIRSIDKSRSRLEALETAMFNHPEFATFCATVKGTIAATERRSA